MRFLQSIGCFAPAAILIYAVVGLLLLGQFGEQALNYLRSTGWQQVPGKIVFGEIEEAGDTTGERYRVHVVYTYEVDSVTYEGTQLDLRGPIYLSDREDAEQILALYPPGKSMMPYFDPTDPTQSVLDRTMPDAVWGFVGFGSALVLLSLVLSVRHLTNRRQNP